MTTPFCLPRRPAHTAAGLDADRGDYASFAEFADPDGNTWLLQKRGLRRGGG